MSKPPYNPAYADEARALLRYSLAVLVVAPPADRPGLLAPLHPATRAAVHRWLDQPDAGQALRRLTDSDLDRMFRAE